MAGVKLLAVETSSPIFSVAVCAGSEILAFLQVDGQGRPSSLLTDLIERVLQKAGMKMEGLDGFAISIGPGSFTGLRIGVMTVKTLAWALKKPVVPVSSLEVIAHNVIPVSFPQKGESIPSFKGMTEGAELLVFLDARKGNVYAARFAWRGSDLVRLTPDLLQTPAAALADLRGPVWVIGDGLKKYGPLVEQGAAKGWSAAAPEWGIPRADPLCRIAAGRWPESKVDDVHSLVPQYLYSQESDIIGK